MDAIKKKMQGMKIDKDSALERAAVCEQEARDASSRAEKAEEEARNLQKKIQTVENDLDQTQEALTQVNTKLEEKNKALQNAESEVAALNRRIQLLEEDLERSEERLGSASAKLSEASQAADESERARKILENRSLTDEERMDALENQLKEARFLAEEADKKYDEVARKLAMVEADLERAEERAEQGENKIVELEEELRVVGNNLKSLEVSEEKANQREEEYKNQIKTLNTRLKEAEARAEFAERSVQKLQKEVDRLEDDLIHEAELLCEANDDLDRVIAEMIPGSGRFYNWRNPKPRTPTPPPEEIKAQEPVVEAIQGNVEGENVEDAALVKESDVPAEIAAVEPEVPKEPSPAPKPKTPPPFEYVIDLPPEGAEVPYVKNCEPGLAIVNGEEIKIEELNVENKTGEIAEALASEAPGPEISGEAQKAPESVDEEVTILPASETVGEGEPKTPAPEAAATEQNPVEVESSQSTA